MIVLTTLLAILPGLIICYLIYRFDKNEKEKLLPLTISFGLGVLATMPAMYLEMLGDKMGIVESPNIWMTLLLAFVVVAFTEELVKFVCLMLYPFQKSFFNEPLDGIVYAVMIGMGFATLENIIYGTRMGIGTIGVRAFTAVPAHFVFAVVSGYFVGKAKFQKEKRIYYSVVGLLSAVFLHGIYDFFILQQNYDWLMSFSLLVLILSFYLSWKMLKEHQANSQIKELELGSQEAKDGSPKLEDNS